jgi:hypothetical protein
MNAVHIQWWRMTGDMFNKGQKPRGEAIPFGDIAQNLCNAFQTEPLRDEVLIKRATLDLLNYATDPQSAHSEHARSGIIFRLTAGTLAEQKERLRLGDPAHDALNDLLAETHRIVTSLADHPNLKHELCTYLIRPALPEEDRFATRELLEMHAVTHGRDAQMKDSMRLAESLAILEKPLRLDSGEMRLDEIAALTEQPGFWIAVLDNIIDGSIRRTNHEALVNCLKKNLARLQEDSTVQAHLASLARSTDPLSVVLHTQLLGQQQPTQSELDLEGPTIDPFDL